MKWYFVASNYRLHSKFLVKHNVEHVLVTFAEHVQSGKINPDLMEAAKEGRLKLMLDSGAFTNFSKPGFVSLKAFRGFLEGHANRFSEIVTFDDLRSRSKTIKNYRVLKNDGHDVLFVDHIYFRWNDSLQPFYKSGNKLCFGSLVKKTSDSQTHTLLEQLEKRMDAAREKPKSKVHLLGVGTRVKKFLPHLDVVDSLDTSSWFTGPARFGGVVIAKAGEDGWPFLQHDNYRHMTEEVRSMFRKAGLDPNHHLGRVEMAVKAFKKFFRLFDARYKKAIESKEDLVEKSMEDDDSLVQKALTVTDAMEAIEES